MAWVEELNERAKEHTVPYFITDTCIGCSVCELKCPTDTISGKKKETFVIHPEGCIECGVCAVFCPVSCIQNQFGELVQGVKPAQIPKAVVDPRNCTGCEFCVDICPFDCISMQEDPTGEAPHFKVAVVEPKDCVSCRLCEIVCDKDAIVVPDPVTNLAPMVPQHLKKKPRSEHQDPDGTHLVSEFYRNEDGGGTRLKLQTLQLPRE